MGYVEIFVADKNAARFTAVFHFSSDVIHFKPYIYSINKAKISYKSKDECKLVTH